MLIHVTLKHETYNLHETNMMIYTDIYIVCRLNGGIMEYYWNVIKLYLVLWLRQGEILQFLNTGDDIILSVRTVRQILQSMRLYRGSPTLWR